MSLSAFNVGNKRSANSTQVVPGNANAGDMAGEGPARGMELSRWTRRRW